MAGNGRLLVHYFVEHNFSILVQERSFPMQHFVSVRDKHLFEQTTDHYMKLCAYSKTPKLHQSTAAPYFFPNSNSGAIYSAVPILQYNDITTTLAPHYHTHTAKSGCSSGHINVLFGQSKIRECQVLVPQRKTKRRAVSIIEFSVSTTKAMYYTDPLIIHQNIFQLQISIYYVLLVQVIKRR